MDREDEHTVEVRVLRDRARQLEDALEQARVKIRELEEENEALRTDLASVAVMENGG